MTKEELTVLQSIAEQLLMLCSNARIEAEEFELKAKKTRELFLSLNKTAGRSENNVDSKLNKKALKRSQFTKEELNEMPLLKELKYRFREQDQIHEFRYRRKGVNKSFCSKEYKKAKQKALAFCQGLNNEESFYINRKDELFNNFAENYLFLVKRKNVTPKTFANMYNRFKKHIKPAFEGKRLSNVTAPFIQNFLNSLIDQGYQRTCEDCYFTIKIVLEYAVDLDILKKNPTKPVCIPLMQRKQGQAMTFADEKAFVQAIKGNKYELTFLTMLYTGIRPCELPTLTIEREGFFTFQNMKQKKGKVVFKDIPVTPMLAPYVERIKENLPLNNTTELTKIFSALVDKKYRMYDMRHTFSTRCQECGVPQEIVNRWLGHSAMGTNDRYYTHFSHSYMLEQAKKVVY